MKLYSLGCVLILAMSIKYTQSTVLEEPKTQYALVGKNATFTCNWPGSSNEVYWTLNHIPMTITYEAQKQGYMDKGVVFMEDFTNEYYNLTMIMYGGLELNNTLIFCTVLGRDWTVSAMSQEVRFIIFNTFRPYAPAVNVNISYTERPTVVATISEIPRWPGYEVAQFKMNITNSEGNTLLGRYNVSVENATMEIRAPLPDSVINQCKTLKIFASAVSEQYGEGDATEISIELFKTPGSFTDEGVRHLILPHTNDSLFHVSLNVKLPDICNNQQVKYKFLVENENSSEVIQTRGPYIHHGPGNVSHCIDGLEKNNSYSVVVQVESIAGNRKSDPTYLNTSKIQSCSTEDGYMTTPTVVQPTVDYNIVEQINEKSMDRPMLQEVIILSVLLVVLLVILAGMTGAFIWFYKYHQQKIQRKAQSYERSKKVMVHNPIYCEPLYDKVGGPPNIAIPPVPLSASDTHSITSSPPIGTPTPLLSTHYAHQGHHGHHGQKFVYGEKMGNVGQTIILPLPQEPDEPYTMMCPAPGSPKSPKEKGSEA